MFCDNRVHQKQTKTHGDKVICISFSSLSWIFTNDQKNFSGMIYLEAAVFGLPIYRTCESAAILGRLSEGEREWNSSVFLLQVELNYTQQLITGQTWAVTLCTLPTGGSETYGWLVNNAQQTIAESANLAQNKEDIFRLSCIVKQCSLFSVVPDRVLQQQMLIADNQFNSFSIVIQSKYDFIIWYCWPKRKPYYRKKTKCKRLYYEL